MIEAGSIEIIGTINIESVKSGLNELKSSLSETKKWAAASFGDLSNVGKALDKIATPLAAIAIGLAASALGIAALSPQVAPVIARMQVEFFKLSNILGQELRPVFERVSELFTKFVDWLDSPEGRGVLETFAGILDGLITTVENVGVALSGISRTISLTFDASFGEGSASKLLEWLVVNVGPAAAAAAIGWKIAGPAGAVAAGGVTFGVTNLANSGNNAPGSLGRARNDILGYGGLGATAGLIGGVPGAIFGGVAGAAIGGAKAGGEWVNQNVFGGRHVAADVANALWNAMGSMMSSFSKDSALRNANTSRD